MLDHLETESEIVAVVYLQRPVAVDRLKARGVDEDLGRIDPGAVEATHGFDVVLPERSQPCAKTTADIDDGPGLDQGQEDRNDDARRLQGDFGLEIVERAVVRIGGGGHTSRACPL